MKNLELYGGPADGLLMEMITREDPTGGIRRPATVTIHGSIYKIDLAEVHEDKKPIKGITHIGVYSGPSN